MSFETVMKITNSFSHLIEQSMRHQSRNGGVHFFVIAVHLYSVLLCKSVVKRVSSVFDGFVIPQVEISTGAGGTNCGIHLG